MPSSGSLNEIENSLPNGFHDGLLEGISIDFVSKKARLDLQLCVGDVDAENEKDRDAYKKATLHIENLLYFVIDPPDGNYDFSKATAWRIDAGDANEICQSQSPKPLISLPKNAFAYWFFIVDSNSFIHIAAMGASLSWVK